MDVLIYGIIGQSDWWDDGVSITDTAIYSQLSDMNLSDSKLDVRINSLGGSCSHGITIYNTLRNFAMKRRVMQPEFRVRTIVDGFAYSAASLILMAGDEIVMNTGTLAMIHNASQYVYGNAAQLRTDADVLEKLSQEIGRVYAKHTGMKADDIFALMDAETYMTPDEALSMKFITAIDAGDEQATSQKKEQFGKDFSKPLARGQYDQLMHNRYQQVMRANPSQKKVLADPPDMSWLLGAELQNEIDRMVLAP